MTNEALIGEWLESHVPGARLERTWPLEGGISTAMTAFEFSMPADETLRRILRKPSEWRLRQNPKAAEHEFRLLGALHAHGVPVQRPCAFIQPGDALVIEYLQGAPEIDPIDKSAFVARYAQQLAAIHAIDWETLGLEFLTREEKGYPNPWKGSNETLREPEIRAVVEPREVRSTGAVLRHGDFWPGNVLWREGAITGVIDWEEALIGDPLADLGICRLDLWWVLGEEASDEFTERYGELTGLDLSELPYWDLCASLRPMANLEDWAGSYPALGRPDITYETMARDHQAFVARALKNL